MRVNNWWGRPGLKAPDDKGMNIEPLLFVLCACICACVLVPVARAYALCIFVAYAVLYGLCVLMCTFL